MFVDKVTIRLIAGKGGDGFVSFRHEKFVDRGGPDGGDGGDGGDIVIEASNNHNNLAPYRYKKEIKADDGISGSKRKKHGASAKELLLKLPVGTVVFDKNGELLVDLTRKGQKKVIAHGGKGGFGNAHFVSSRRQAPRVAEKGDRGDVIDATFELKMIADAGLIGLPNAGKSTLLSKISNARPEIANYPFTTLVPQLGVVDIDSKKSILVADIPGLIKGASHGKGLGDEFLRHVERTKVLVHIIDAYQEDICGAYTTIMDELSSYVVNLSRRPHIVAINKIDGMPEDMVQDIIATLKEKTPKNTSIYPISAKSGLGVKDLLHCIAKKVGSASKKEQVKSKKEAIPILKLDDTSDAWHVKKLGKKYFVTGEKIERFARRTDFENPAGIERLRDIMRKMGIMHELERKKINPGEKIHIGHDGKNQLEY